MSQEAIQDQEEVVAEALVETKMKEEWKEVTEEVVVLEVVLTELKCKDKEEIQYQE